MWTPIETITVPFTTRVTLGSSVVPGETVFDLELVDANGAPASAEGVNVSGSVTTNGAGSYNGALTLTGPERQIQRHLLYGIGGVFVRQVDAGAAGWTLDDRAWRVMLDWTPDSEDFSSLRIYPATVSGGKYVVDWNESPVERMQFSRYR